MIAIKKQSNCVPPTDPPTFNCAFSLSFLSYSLLLLGPETRCGTLNGTTPAESGPPSLLFQTIQVIFGSITDRPVFSHKYIVENDKLMKLSMEEEKESQPIRERWNRSTNNKGEFTGLWFRCKLKLDGLPCYAT